MPVHELGRGRPVLLLHGISADHTEWAEVAGDLARDHRVILPDMLGRGMSRPASSARFSLEDETDRLVAVLVGVAVERPLVAGHSHGASLALALSTRTEVAGLLLVSPVTPWTRRPAILGLLANRLVRRCVAPVLRTCRRSLTRYILTRRVYGEHRPHIGDAVRRYSDPFADPARSEALLRIFRDWKPATLEHLEPPRELPIAVMTGGADRRIQPKLAARWADRLRARCTVVPGAGHGLTEELPALVAARLRELGRAADHKFHERDS